MPLEKRNAYLDLWNLRVSVQRLAGVKGIYSKS